MEVLTIPKIEFERMQNELNVLRNSKLYRRLLEFEYNIINGKKYTREELGF